MSICEHNVFCPGYGPEHDFATIELDVLLGARRQGKALLRSGDPAQRALGESALRRSQAALNHGLFLKRAEEA